MKILLDENLPKNLKKDLSQYKVFTVREMRWNGLQNGELLNKMLAAKIDVFITVDKNLSYQQNLKKYPISVVLLNVVRLTYSYIAPLIPQLSKFLQGELKPGFHIISNK